MAKKRSTNKPSKPTRAGCLKNAIKKHKKIQAAAKPHHKPDHTSVEYLAAITGAGHNGDTKHVLKRTPQSIIDAQHRNKAASLAGERQFRDREKEVVS
jgi:hypothetical protein